MNKKKALDIINLSAKTYQKNLLNHNFLFIIDDKKIPFFEVLFLETNFKHLTGIDCKLEARVFFIIITYQMYFYLPID